MGAIVIVLAVKERRVRAAATIALIGAVLLGAGRFARHRSSGGRRSSSRLSDTTSGWERPPTATASSSDFGQARQRAHELMAAEAGTVETRSPSFYYGTLGPREADRFDETLTAAAMKARDGRPVRLPEALCCGAFLVLGAGRDRDADASVRLGRAPPRRTGAVRALQVGLAAACFHDPGACLDLRRHLPHGPVQRAALSHALLPGRFPLRKHGTRNSSSSDNPPCDRVAYEQPTSQIALAGTGIWACIPSQQAGGCSSGRGDAVENIEQSQGSEAFGAYLKKLREVRRLSLDAVEELSATFPEKVTKSHLSRIENGLALPTFPRLMAMSHIYGIPIASLSERYEIELRRSMKPVDLEGKSDEEALREFEALVFSGDFNEALILVWAMADRCASRGGTRRVRSADLADQYHRLSHAARTIRTGKDPMRGNSQPSQTVGAGEAARPAAFCRGVLRLQLDQVASTRAR